MYLHEHGLSAVILVEIRQPHMIPTAQAEIVVVDVVEDIVLIHIPDDHVVRPAFTSLLRIVQHDLHIRLSVTVFIHPIDDKVFMAAIQSVAVAVYQQAVVDHISLPVARFQIPIIVKPKHRNIPVRHRLYGIVPAVAIQIQILGDMAFGSRRQTQRDKMGTQIPVRALRLLRKATEHSGSK